MNKQAIIITFGWAVVIAIFAMVFLPNKSDAFGQDLQARAKEQCGKLGVLSSKMADIWVCTDRASGVCFGWGKYNCFSGRFKGLD
jgi:hypothetical protein